MRTDGLVMLAVIAIALGVRGVAGIGIDFPINDGGLFVAMTMELERHGWTLPASVAWNGRDIPFAYPPLGLYLTGALTALGMEVEIVLRVIPIIVSTAAAGLIVAIARNLLASHAGSVAAGLTYAFAPAAFTWAIAGGGVTRAPGMLLALGTIWLLLRLRDRPSDARGVLVGLAAGATVLTHPASAAFAALSSVLLLLASLRSSNRSSAEVLRSAAVALGVAVLVVIPWAIAVVAAHGIDVFVDAPSNGPDLFAAVVTLVAGRITGLGTDPLGLLIVGFAIMSVVRGRLLFPVWLLAASFLGDQYAIVPASLLIGSLVVDGVQWAGSRDVRRRLVGRIAVAVTAILLVVEAGIGVNASAAESSHLHALGPERRDAMRWMASNTPEGATVAVLTGDQWSTDPDSEWFYVLTDRPSIATVQGSEWLGRDNFDRAEHGYGQLQRCTTSIACLDAWLEAQRADYLFIPKGRRHGPASPEDCCAGARADLRSDDRYDVVYDGPGATIARVPPAQAGSLHHASIASPLLRCAADATATSVTS